MTTPFFNNINLGITSKCNAHCDYCNRNTFKAFPDMNQDMSLKTFQKIVPYTKNIDFCGSYGDFCNHPNPFPFLELCSNITFNVETNAGRRSLDFWKELAKYCNNEKQYVQFSIDDIRNELNPYRKVKTEIVLKNLKAFINAGGYAVVKTLLFKFNETQMEDMRLFFAELGVHKHLKQFSMIYEKGDLAPPKGCKYEKGTLPFLYNVSKHITKPPKSCQWNDGKWLYVLDNGEVHPCCNIVTYAAFMNDTMPYIGEYTSYDEYGKLYDIYVKNKELINLNTEGVTLESAYWNEYNKYVRDNFKKIPRCIKRCGLNNYTTNPITGII